ncbi:MAG: DUF4145 domain-containing protein [Gammaproteobacteria bacterium]|nr:DUF4145 domain-containing protein [Gammaproteobacteria bacterium]
MNGSNWICKYCDHAQVLSYENCFLDHVNIYNKLSKYGNIVGTLNTIVCTNSKCKELTVSLSINSFNNVTYANGIPNYNGLKEINFWQLLPESSSKPQPDYIPRPIVKDYQQACLIRDLAPNASATLSRRCLQGMIRDFCKISGRNLDTEINKLKKQLNEGKGPKEVHPDIIDSIDKVRLLGNIGAHMQKDINLILDVEPEEAQALIELIEILFREWYVARQVRQERINKLEIILNNKNEIKDQSKTTL